MHVRDPVRVAPRELDRVGAREGHVPGVEQQLDRRPGTGHQRVDVLRGLHHRAHVVMKGHAHSAAAHALGELGEPRAIILPAAARHVRPLRKTRAAIAVDVARDLGDHHDFAAEREQQLEMRLHRGKLAVHVAFEQPRAVPARDQREAVRGQDGLELGRVARELVTELHPLVARRASFPQTGLEWDLRAEGGHVVVAPGERIDPQPDVHLGPFSSRRRWYSRRAFCTAALSDTSATGTSHQAPPAPVASTALVSMTMTDVDAPLRERSSAAVSAGIPVTCSAVRAQRARVCGKVDRRSAPPGLVEQVVEGFAAAGLLQAVDAAKAAVIEHHDRELEAERDRGRDL